MTPIAIFAYNRPNHLQLTLEALQRADGFDQCPLHIFCDGGKNVEATRIVARASGATVHERKRNYGFGNITCGITEMCEQYGRVIVIEDDNVVSPDFLTFMKEGLDRYEKDERVWSINGFMYPGVHNEGGETFFLPTAFPQAWATWKRAWDHFEWRPSGWKQLLKQRKRRRRFDFAGQWRMSGWLARAMRGDLACWDPQWAFKVFDSDGVSLFPSRPLMWNTGLDCGVHGAAMKGPEESLFKGKHQFEDFAKPQLSADWSFPEKVETDEGAYSRMVDFFRSQKWKRRIPPLQKWRCLF